MLPTPVLVSVWMFEWYRFYHQYDSSASYLYRYEFKLGIGISLAVLVEQYLYYLATNNYQVCTYLRTNIKIKIL